MADLSWIKFPQANIGLVEPTEEQAPETDLSWINPGGPPLPTKSKEKTSFLDEGLPPFSMFDYLKVGKPKTVKAFERGMENAQNYITFSDAMYGVSEEDPDIAKNRIALAKVKQREEPIKGGLLREPLYRGAEVAGGMYAAGAKGSKEGLIGMGAGALAGALYTAPASVGPQGLLVEPGGIAVGAVAGGLAGLKIGAGLAWWKMSSGEMMYNMLEEGVPADTARTIAGIAAIPYTLVEMYQVKALTPNLKALIHKQLTKTVPKIMYRAIKKYGAVWTEEVAEEVVQEMIALTAENIAKEASGQKVKFDKPTVRENLIRLWETTKSAGVSMAYLPIPGVAVQAGVEAVTPGLSPKQAKMVIGAEASQGNLEEILATAKLEKPKEGVEEEPVTTPLTETETKAEPPAYHAKYIEFLQNLKDKTPNDFSIRKEKGPVGFIWRVYDKKTQESIAGLSTRKEAKEYLDKVLRQAVELSIPPTETGIPAKAEVDVFTPEERDWVERHIKKTEKTIAAEKDRYIKLSPEEQALWKKDWKAFSLKKGYSAKQVADYKEYLKSVEEGESLGFTQDFIFDFDRHIEQLWQINRSLDLVELEREWGKERRKAPQPDPAKVEIQQPDSDQADLSKAVQIADVDPSQVDNVPTKYQRQQVHSLARQMGLDDESRHQLYQEIAGKSWDQMGKADAQSVLDFLKLQVRTLHTQQRAKGLGLTDKESDMLQKLAGNEDRYIALLNIIGNIEEMPQDKDERRFVLDNYKSLAREMNKWAKAKEAGPQFTIFGTPKKHNLLSHWASVRYALARAEMRSGQSLRLPYENIVMYTKMSREISFKKVWDIYKSIYAHPTLGGIFYQQNEALRWYLFAPETPEGQQAAQKMNSQTKALADQLQPLLKDYGGLLSGALRFKLWVYKGMVPESLALMGVQKEELQRIFSEGVKAWNDHTFASWIKTQQWAAKDNYYMSQRAAESFSLDFLNSIIGEPEPKPAGVAVPKGEDIPSEVYAREEEGKLIPAEGPVIDNIIYHFARMNTAIFAMDDLMEFWNNFKKAKPTRDDVAIMKTFMGHALGHGEISTGANKFLGKLFGGGFNRFFWRAYFLNPSKGLWFFIRNLWQNMAYGPSQLGLSEAFKATSDIAFGKGRDQRAADYAQYGKSTISEKQQMFRQAMMVEQGTITTPIRGEITGKPIQSAAEVLRRLGMIADIMGNLAVSSDEINRQWAWSVIHRATQRNVELYRRGEITHKQLISRLKIKTLDSTQRNELQALLTKKKDADFIRQTARYKVENIHFRYETALRSAAEQSNIARATIGLITFQRGTFEIIWHNGLKRMVEGIQNQDYNMAYKGLTNFLNVVFWSGISKIMLYKIFGKKDYGLFSTLLSFGPISPGLGKLKEWSDGMRRITTAEGTVDEKVNKMLALFAGFTEWAVPLVDVGLRWAEIQHDEKGITIYRQLKQKLLSRYERLYNRPYTKVDRTEWQKIMHLLIGGFEDPAKEAEMMDSLFGVL